jgi:hypothetical protein
MRGARNLIIEATLESLRMVVLKIGIAADIVKRYLELKRVFMLSGSYHVKVTLF